MKDMIWLTFAKHTTSCHISLQLSGSSQGKHKSSTIQTGTEQKAKMHQMSTHDALDLGTLSVSTSMAWKPASLSLLVFWNQSLGWLKTKSAKGQVASSSHPVDSNPYFCNTQSVDEQNFWTAPSEHLPSCCRLHLCTVTAHCCSQQLHAAQLC